MTFQDLIYKHKKGHFYRIVHFGIAEETMEPEVAYRRCDSAGKFTDGNIWHRKCTVFFDGRFKPYFSDLDDDEEVTNLFAELDANPRKFIDVPEQPVSFVRRKPEPLVLDKQAFLKGTDEEAPVEEESSEPRHVVPRRVLSKTAQQIEAGLPDYP